MTPRKIAIACSLLVASVPALVFRVSAAAPAFTVRDVQAAMDRLDPPGSCGQGAATTLSCFQPDTQVEPSIAVNPADPMNAVASFQEGRVDGGGDADNGWATTTDGGATWIYGDVPKLTRAVGGEWDRASDAAVAFGPNGTVYINSLVLKNDGTSGLTVNVSHDGGRTWGDPVVIIQDNVNNDKNWIVVDDSDAPGHHLGRVYVVWDRVAPVVAAYSDDEGATWQTSKYGFIVYPGQGIAAIPVVMNNGDLAVVFATASHPLPVVHSTPHVEEEETVNLSRWSIATAPGAGSLPTGAPLVFAPPVTVGVPAVAPEAGQRSGGFPAVDVDRRTGRLYVAWNDTRFRSDYVNDIVLTYSDDGGITWSPVTRVNPGPTDDYVDRWCAMLGVGADGSVNIAYRVRGEPYGPDAELPSEVDTYYQRSTDAGKTFSDPVKINAVPSDMGFGAVSRGGVFLGDYDQLAVGGDRVYIARAEPLKTDESEIPFFTPIYHHQRMYVATVTPA